jgi:NAD(P)-dependent dehydrogenase (short-subunit alcohol dehydrogenase family)
MSDKRIALVTGANQGVGLQVAKELVTNGVTVLVGSRNCERGEAAAREIGAHPFRTLDNVLATPHLGYVSHGLYKTFYEDTVSNIRKWIDSH